MALGAGRSRILVQLLTESLLLAIAGGVAGLLVGGWTMDLLTTLAPKNLPRLNEIKLDVGVLGFALLLSLATGVLFGLGPAWNISRLDINESLKSSPNRSTGRRRLFNAMVTAEIALTLATLIGAGLLINSFLRLQRIEPGVDVDRLLTASFEPPSAQYNYENWQAQRLNFWRGLSARVAALPGVEAVGAIDSLPLSGRGRVYPFRKSEDPATATIPSASFQVVTPDYFRAAGVHLLRGRTIADSDRRDTPPVAVINQTMARQFWPEEDAIGKRIFIRNDEFPTEIVGVVTDVRQFSLEQSTQPEMYRPFEQVTIGVMPIVVRAKGDPAALASAIRVERIAPMSELLSDTLAQRRFIMFLLTVFAGTALTLAAVGVYGVMAYTVSERTREIGMRMALGASRNAIFRMVLRQGLGLALIGIALGTPAALAGARAISSLLFQVRPTDVLTFGIISVLLGLVSLIACLIPALSATKVDPMVALKAE
jgi:putative ABC transport system permease protein